MNSNVSHPTHYNQGKFEVIEIIEDQQLNFHTGNAIKYICRAGKKDPTKHIEDLEKAKWYLQREIERLKAWKEERDPVKPNNMNAAPFEFVADCRLGMKTVDDETKDKLQGHRWACIARKIE